jgi:hypothetical protein
VAAPSGAIAFYRPTALEHLLAGLFGKAAYAIEPGLTAVGAGVTVNLSEIDNTGTQVGQVIATTTTDVSGRFTLSPPADFQPASKYVVRVVGNTSSMDAFVIGTQVDVDPYTHTTRVLITGALAGAALNGTVTKGGTPVDGAVVQVRSGGLSSVSRFISTRTQSDGSYTISLPAGTYSVCAFDVATSCPGTVGAGATYRLTDGVVMTAGAAKTVNFGD